MMLKRFFFIFFIAIFVIKTTPFFLIKDNKKDLDRDMYIILSKLRCIQCAGESILESSSSFARIIKDFIHSRLKEKKNRKDIMNELVNFFGSNILM